MALARVVTFEGVDGDRVRQLKSQMESGERPDNLPATEFLLLHDADSDKAVVVVFFDSEDDYATGDATLSSMPADDTPGKRTSVDKYDVALRMKD